MRAIRIALLTFLDLDSPPHDVNRVSGRLRGMVRLALDTIQDEGFRRAVCFGNIGQAGDMPPVIKLTDLDPTHLAPDSFGNICCRMLQAER